MIEILANIALLYYDLHTVLINWNYFLCNCKIVVVVVVKLWREWRGLWLAYCLGNSMLMSEKESAVCTHRLLALVVRQYLNLVSWMCSVLAVFMFCYLYRMMCHEYWDLRLTWEKQMKTTWHSENAYLCECQTILLCWKMPYLAVCKSKKNWCWIRIYTVSQKNIPSVVSHSLVKHYLILIIFGNNIPGLKESFNFPPHLTDVSALPGETEKCKFDSFLWYVLVIGSR